MNSSPAAADERTHRNLPAVTPAQPDRTRRLRRRDDERGLTTLEWLLIVAAVAGLAAVAVVVVQGVVSDTSDQIAGSGARITTAEFEADDITDEAMEDLPAEGPFSGSATEKTQQEEAFTAGLEDINERYEDRCNRLNIAYGTAFEDAGKTAQWTDAWDDNGDFDLADDDDDEPACEIVDS